MSAGSVSCRTPRPRSALPSGFVGSWPLAPMQTKHQVFLPLEPSVSFLALQGSVGLPSQYPRPPPHPSFSPPISVLRIELSGLQAYCLSFPHTLNRQGFVLRDPCLGYEWHRV